MAKIRETMSCKVIAESLGKTRKMAADLAREIMASAPTQSSALVIALAGDLGSGKTVFAKAFIRALGIRQRITSPTFVIFKSYKLRKLKLNRIFHIDCYRIRRPEELLALGFKDIVSEPKNIVLIEWADRIKKILPRNTIWIRFRHGEKKNERVINYENFSYN